MKINEVIDKLKVMQSSPQGGVNLASPDGSFTMTMSPEQARAITPDPQNPKSSMLDLSNVSLGQPATGQPATSTDQPPASGQPATGQPATGQPATGQPASGQPASTDQPAATGQQPQLPQVGSEVELSDEQLSTMESFNNKDLMKSGKNADIGGRNGGDKTDDFIDDVIDHDFDRKGRSKRKFATPEPVRESEELIAMLTIAGLR